jgi:hypothetical protein
MEKSRATFSARTNKTHARLLLFVVQKPKFPSKMESEMWQ